MDARKPSTKSVSVHVRLTEGQAAQIDDLANKMALPDGSPLSRSMVVRFLLNINSNMGYTLDELQINHLAMRVVNGISQVRDVGSNNYMPLYDAVEEYLRSSNISPEDTIPSLVHGFLKWYESIGATLI